MKLNILIYIDPQKPGFSYFRDILRRLKQGHIVVIYPEGTRSKSGRMIEPKTGFVKVALTTGTPIVPLAMKGAYDVLPPHKTLPRFRKCEINVGEPFLINADNPMFRDVFESEKERGLHLSDTAMKEIAFRIMEKIMSMGDQQWDASVTVEPNNFVGRVRKLALDPKEHS